MRVTDLMTRNCISVLPSTTLADAARIMLANHVTGLPVLDTDGKLVGNVSEGDLLRRAELGTDGKPMNSLKAFLHPSSVAEDYLVTHARPVSGVMTHKPASVTPATELNEVAELMLRRHIKRLPVLDEGKLVGVISRTDLLRALVRKLIATKADATDEEIRNYIKSELDHASWAPHSSIRIHVKEKVVELEGPVFSHEERRRVLVIAENTPGVKEVQDHLMYVDRACGRAFPTGF
jgi:CBS domain-containing protein